MRRPAHAENTLARIKGWREVCPDLVIRSTFIVGFPGETEAEFDELLDWLGRRSSIAWDASSIRRSMGRLRTRCRITLIRKSRKSAISASWSWPARSVRSGWRHASASGCACWWTQWRTARRSPAAKATRPRSMGVVHIENAGKLKAGDWAQGGYHGRRCVRPAGDSWSEIEKRGGGRRLIPILRATSRHGPPRARARSSRPGGPTPSQRS